MPPRERKPLFRCSTESWIISRAVSYTHLEATASLDVENESAVQTALSRLLRGKTVLVIAHRMRTVAGADHIVVLEDGHVAQQGAPAELLEQGGLYRRMVELQRESAQWRLGS